MAYFYVCTNTGTFVGTCVDGTGAFGTKQTGAFGSGNLTAGNVYPSIYGAFNDGGAGAGDYICVSDSHSLSQAATIQLYGPTTGDFVYVISVDNANADQYAKATAAQETITAGSYYFNGRIYFHGLHIKVSAYLQVNNAGTKWHCNDCLLEISATGGYPFRTNSYGQQCHLVNCELKAPASTLWMNLRQGLTVRMYGCKTTGVDRMWSWSVGGNGGGKAEVVGCDLTSVTESLMYDGGDVHGEGSVDIAYRGCKLAATEPSITANSIYNAGFRVTVANCSGDSGTAEYQFNVTAGGGQVDEETSTYRDGSGVYPISRQQISYKCVTNTYASQAMPFWFDYQGLRYAKLSSTATDTLRIHLTSDTALTDADVWVEVLYPDATTSHDYTFQSTRHTDIMDTTGTTLSTNTEAWTGAKSNRYHIDVTTSNGADCAPLIRVYCAKASISVYFCSTIETY